MAFMSRGRLPQVDGRLALSGLEQEVSVFRDRWGIPYLLAQTRPDLYFAQGVVHAQDRLFQLEINRRAATGRMAELLGRAALPTDRLTRTLGFARLAEKVWPLLDTQIQADVTAYVAGINAYLDQDRPLPVEMTLLRHRPEPWQPLEPLAFSLLQAWALSLGWTSELVRAQLQETLGSELAGELEPQLPADHAVTLPAGIEVNQLTVDSMVQAATGPLLGKGTLDGGGRGSNAWVISAARSSTGHALLCNDMHLPLSTPGLWYFAHQHCPGDVQVSGVTLPGMPYVMVGRNAHIAWGATLSYIDVEDLFIERLDAAGEQVEWQGEWRPVTVIPETIPVKGEQAHVELVRVTDHGPIISPLLTEQDGPQSALALSSTALQPGRAAAGFAALNRAQNWDDFVAAVALISAPSLNLVYADVQDNIGYYVSGRVPIRAQGDGRAPVPGWTGEHEWTGTIPFAEMPQALNPARGYIISCNHRIVNDDYPHELGAMWMNGFRAQRLEQLINSKAHISPTDCIAFQVDVLSLPGRALVARLAGLEPDEPDAVLSLQLLREWDGQMAVDSPGAAVYKVLLNRLVDIILGNGMEPEAAHLALGNGLFPPFLPTTEYFGYWPITLMRMLENPQTGWLAGQVGREATLIRGLAETAAFLRTRLGNDPHQWHWGRLHQVPFPHLLGEQPPLDRVFNLGPFPIGGDADTVLQTAIRPDAPYLNNIFSPSFRQIIDLGDPATGRAICPPGQSGHLGSPHYGDLIQPWLEGDYFPILMEATEISATCRHHLTLFPVIRPDTSMI
jgi:penicillin amidase